MDGGIDSAVKSFIESIKKHDSIVPVLVDNAFTLSEEVIDAAKRKGDRNVKRFIDKHNKLLKKLVKEDKNTLYAFANVESLSDIIGEGRKAESTIKRLLKETSDQSDFVMLLHKHLYPEEQLYFSRPVVGALGALHKKKSYGVLPKEVLLTLVQEEGDRLYQNMPNVMDLLKEDYLGDLQDKILNTVRKTPDGYEVDIIRAGSPYGRKSDYTFTMVHPEGSVPIVYHKDEFRSIKDKEGNVYVEDIGGEGGAGLYKGKVKLKNPYIFVAKSRADAQGDPMPTQLAKHLGINHEDYYKREAAVFKKLKDMGYDGVIFFRKLPELYAQKYKDSLKSTKFPSQVVVFKGTDGHKMLEKEMKAINPKKLYSIYKKGFRFGLPSILGAITGAGLLGTSKKIAAATLKALNPVGDIDMYSGGAILPEYLSAGEDTLMELLRSKWRSKKK